VQLEHKVLLVYLAAYVVLLMLDRLAHHTLLQRQSVPLHSHMR
jgi:hypothetical protein